MSGHTQGKLEVAVQVFDNDGCPETVIQGMGGAASVAVALDFGPNNPNMRYANARRLVACWNACDGISTETQELVPRFTEAGIKTVQSVEAQRDSLRAVNAELLEALESMTSVINAAGLYNLSRGVQLGATVWYVKASEAMDSARAAIASARKQGEQG